MKLYITLNEETDIDEQLTRLQQLLQMYPYKMLENYESRGYTTFVVQLGADTSEEVLNTLVYHLKI